MTIKFTAKNTDIISYQIQKHIETNIQNIDLITCESVYIYNFQYFLINELLKINKRESALKVIQQIDKYIKTVKTQSKRLRRTYHLKKNDIYYFHSFLVYKDNMALDAAKLIKNKALKKYCLFFINEKENMDILQIFNIKYNKYIIGHFLNQFVDKEKMVDFLDKNVEISWLDSLSYINKMDFYYRTKHIYLCYFFLRAGVINQVDSLTFKYKDIDLKKQIMELLEIIECCENRVGDIIFPQEVCSENIGIDVEIGDLGTEVIMIKDEIKTKRLNYIKTRMVHKLEHMDWKV
ncbi:hypothetical protein CDIK_0327 [Cucumispora dikerogammari]|nr:hypothetical protein CDIK_0327 [Cucumispora dikerogammari]